MNLKRSRYVSGSSLLEVVIASLLISITFILFSGFIADLVFQPIIIKRTEFLMRLKPVNARYGSSLKTTYPGNHLEIDYQSWRPDDGVIVQVYDTNCLTPLVTLYQLKNGLTSDSFFCTFDKIE